MGVYVKLKLKSLLTGKEIEVVGVVNTGFRSDNLDLAIPISIAEKLGLWPLPKDRSLVTILSTGGGDVSSFLIPHSITVKVITEDRESREVIANVLINPFINEILISDTLTEELGIQILFPRKGIWKFIDDDKIRYSVNPEEY